MMKKTSKIAKFTNHSTEQPETPKDRTRRYGEITEKELRFLADEMVHWAETNDKAYDHIEYPIKIGIPLTTYYNWIERYSIWREAVDEAKERIGIRRDEKFLERKHASEARNYIHIFKRTYRDQLDIDRKNKLSDAIELAKIKSQNPDTETKIVILKDYPDNTEK